jgi:hypothetical protein
MANGGPKTKRKLPSGMDNQGERSKARTPVALVGSAGVHHVVSELSRRGIIALPTTRNTPAYDVLASSLDGRRHANIQVKTSLKRVNFFPMPPSASVRCGDQDYYVFLRWLRSESRFEGFMLTGRQARAEVRRGVRFQKKRILAKTRKKLFPSVYVGRKVRRRADKWRERWENWRL